MYIEFLIFLIIILLVKLYTEQKNNQKHREGLYIKSTIDNQEYFVKNTDDKEEAANLIATLKNKLINFCQCLKKKYPEKDNVKRLIERFNSNNIEEGMEDKYTSYSVNKGEKIVLCLRHRSGKLKGQLQDINTLMFVVLHELAHICSISYHHTSEFYDNFAFLMKEAIDCGYYIPITLPKKYCGLTITSSPLDT